MQVSAEEIVKAECESCGADIPIDATECPECGTVFAEGAEKIEEVEIEEEEPEVEEKPGKSLLVGIIIVIVGAGLALGSWLHDVWEIPIGGTAYTSFGWLNISVAVIGIIILVIGIIFVAVSRKKTVIAEEI